MLEQLGLCRGVKEVSTAVELESEAASIDRRAAQDGNRAKFGAHLVDAKVKVEEGQELTLHHLNLLEREMYGILLPVLVLRRRV